MPELTDFDLFWNFSDPAATETAFREVLPLAQSSGNQPYLCELLTQIARTEGLQRRFEDAHNTLDQAEALASSKDGRPRLRVLLERGRAFNSSGKKDQARPLFLEAWGLGRKIREDGLAVDAAHMVAIVETGQSALEWNLKALELAISSDMPSARKWRKSLHNNIGWTYFDLASYPQALEHFEKTKECAQENKDAESERIARWSTAKTLRLMGQVEDALAIQKALALEPDSGPFNEEELGECLFALGQIEEAKPHFAKAYEGLSQDEWLMESDPERVERLKKLSG